MILSCLDRPIQRLWNRDPLGTTAKVAVAFQISGFEAGGGLSDDDSMDRQQLPQGWVPSHIRIRFMGLYHIPAN